MREIGRISIPTKGFCGHQQMMDEHVHEGEAKSLVWDGESLVDWVRGGVRYHLDGRAECLFNFSRYGADASIVSPDGKYVAAYQRFGVKGIVTRVADGSQALEVNRSLYHADDYDFPIAFVPLPDGRMALAYCPEEYCKIEIVDLETKKSLTARQNETADYFHSRLQVSPGGKYLLDAGWVWHPMEMSQVFDVAEALRNPASLEGDGVKQSVCCGEAASAAFADATALVTVHNGEWSDDANPDGSYGEGPHRIPAKLSGSVFDLERQELVSLVPLAEPAGQIYPLGRRYVLGFHGMPRLFDFSTGQVVARWPELAVEEREGCIWNEGMRARTAPHAFAVDAAHLRFAVAGPDAVTVVRLGE